MIVERRGMKTMVLEPAFHYVKLKLFLISCCLPLLPKSPCTVSCRLCSCAARGILWNVSDANKESIHPTSSSGLPWLCPLLGLVFAHLTSQEHAGGTCGSAFIHQEQLRGGRVYYRSQFQTFQPMVSVAPLFEPVS